MPNRELGGLYAEFHIHPVLQAAESNKQGRHIYKDEIYIQIQIKGQKTQIRDRKMKEEDKFDYPNAWERWQRKNESLTDGTPIKMMPGIGPSMEMELRGLGIRSVEDLKSMTDAACTSMRGGYTLRTRAIQYLAAAAVPQDVRDTIDQKTQNEPPVDVDVLKNDPTVIAKKKGRPRKVVNQ